VQARYLPGVFFYNGGGARTIPSERGNAYTPLFPLATAANFSHD
jgi:hypothetical protein